MNSLRTRLLIWLLGALLLIGVAGGFVIYRNSLAEANAFFDYHLRETALLLRDQAYGFAAPEGLPQEVPQYDFVVQVWSLDGQRLYQSQPQAVLPAATTLGLSTVDSPAGRWRVFGVIARGHVIQVAQALRIREQRAARLALRTLAPFGVLMPALALLIWWIVGRSLRPLGELASSVRTRSPAALDPLPSSSLPDEVRPLVDALNDLLSRLAAALQHERAFIADAAHELRSPLTALSLQLQALQSATGEPERAAASGQLKAGVARATRLVEQLLTLARHERRPAHEPAGPVALDDLARAVVTELVPLADSKQIDLGVAVAEPATVPGDADALRVLVRNLVDNAISYTPQAGRVDVSVRRETSEGASRAVIEVSDTGPGIPVAERERVFDRFYRVPGTASPGSGIGLAIVKAIADQHGAQVELGSGADGRGLRVRVLFPAAAAAA
ncbi:MAG: HAMP domain-containing protein [Gammaproteobacteria bacterium]|nr:HAMP domain-containing protein [Gammaproteobacteria bacterium]